MDIWILIIFFHMNYNGGAAIHSVEYSSKYACKQAVIAVSGPDVRAVCTKKDQ